MPGVKKNLVLHSNLWLVLYNNTKWKLFYVDIKRARLYIPICKITIKKLGHCLIERTTVFLLQPLNIINEAIQSILKNRPYAFLSRNLFQQILTVLVPLWIQNNNFATSRAAYILFLPKNINKNRVTYRNK